MGYSITKVYGKKVVKCFVLNEVLKISQFKYNGKDS